MTSRLPKIILLSLTMALTVTCLAQDGQNPVARKGILDLRKANLFSKPLSLNGEWGFYWNRLLSPDSLSAVAPAYVPYPVLWKEITLNGEKIPSLGYATYTLTVLLPPQRPRIGLEVPDAYCSFKLFVNGIVQAQNGQPATTKEKARPFWVTRTIVLPPVESDTMVMVMQIANFWHARGGPYKDILLGDKDELILKKYRDSAYDFLLAGCMFMGGLFFLGLFVFGRQDKTILYFALFCIVFSYRMVGTNHYPLHSLFTDLDWFITVRIEYLTLSVGIALFAVYTRKLYPEDAHEWIMRAMVLLCVFYSLLILFAPTLVFTRFLYIFLMLMFICIAYAMYVYLQAARNRRSGSLFALLSTAVMLMIFLVMNLHYFGIIPDLRLLL